MANIAAYEVPEPGVFGNAPLADARLPWQPIASALGAELYETDARGLMTPDFRSWKGDSFTIRSSHCAHSR
jgi:hypothetical protein